MYCIITKSEEAKMTSPKRRMVSGVDSKTWALLSGLARMHQMTAGQYLTMMIQREAQRLLKVDIEEETKKGEKEDDTG